MVSGNKEQVLSLKTFTTDNAVPVQYSLLQCVMMIGFPVLTIVFTLF